MNPRSCYEGLLIHLSTPKYNRSIRGNQVALNWLRVEPQHCDEGQLSYPLHIDRKIKYALSDN